MDQTPRRRPRLTHVALAGAAAAFTASSPTPSRAETPAPTAAVVLDDPAGDDRGPGDYVHPSDPRFARGLFDLRRFEARPQADHLELRITVGRPVRPPVEPRVSGAATLDLDNGIYVQNIDVYLDLTPGEGITESIPGRRVRFHPKQGWELAVVLTPQPHATRSLLEDWGLPASRVIVPSTVRREGPTLVARLPYDRLGGPPPPGWGVAITISGAAWQESLALLDRLVDTHRLDAYTLPVHTVAESEAFGGGAIGASHPQVIDLFTPPGVTQAQALGGAGPAGFTTIPMIYPDPAAARAAGFAVELFGGADGTGAIGSHAIDATAEPSARVRDVLEATVVIVDAPADLAPFRLGEVIGADGARAGKVVITAIHPEFVTATVVEGLAAIRRGMAVRFPDAPDSKE